LPKIQLTTDFFWDCECDEDYIHSQRTRACQKCGTAREDQPDSIVSEVYDFLMETYNGIPSKMLVKGMRVRTYDGIVVKLLDNSHQKIRLVETVANTPVIGDTGSVYVYDMLWTYLSDGVVSNKSVLPVVLSLSEKKLSIKVSNLNKSLGS